ASAAIDEVVEDPLRCPDAHEPADHDGGAVWHQVGHLLQRDRLHRIAVGYCASQPPSTGSATPRICAAASEQRNVTAAPICSGVAHPSDGCFSARSACFASSRDRPRAAAMSSICFCTSGVRTHPGQIALQVMPVVAVSSATTFVRPSTPCLAATYAALS